MSAQSISQPLTGKQVKQRLSGAVSDDISALINAANAAAARVAISAQQQNDGLDFIASSNPTDPGPPPTSIPGQTYVLGTNGWQLTMALDDIQDKYLPEHGIWIGGAGGTSEDFATGAKGRELLAIETAAALQAEIVERLESATIAPDIVAATGKISTTSTSTDSIETAGGAIIRGTGSTPSATAGRTNINNGRIDTAERVIARSTAADAIESLGGVTFGSGRAMLAGLASNTCDIRSASASTSYLGFQVLGGTRRAHIGSSVDNVVAVLDASGSPSNAAIAIGSTGLVGSERLRVNGKIRGEVANPGSFADVAEIESFLNSIFS